MDLEQAILSQVEKTIGPDYSIVKEAWRVNQNVFTRKRKAVAYNYNIYHRSYPMIRAGGFCVDEDRYPFRLATPIKEDSVYFNIPSAAIQLYAAKVVAEAIASVLTAMKAA